MIKKVIKNLQIFIVNSFNVLSNENTSMHFDLLQPVLLRKDFGVTTIKQKPPSFHILKEFFCLTTLWFYINPFSLLLYVVSTLITSNDTNLEQK